MKWPSNLLLAAVATLPACHAQRASEEQCRLIFDRLVVLELEEAGFVDPALAQRRQAELSARYGHEIASCVGRRIPAGALACAMAAKDAEAISHNCLR